MERDAGVLKVPLEIKESPFMWSFPQIVETSHGNHRSALLLYNSASIIEEFEQSLKEGREKEAADLEVESIMEDAKELEVESSFRAPPNTPELYVVYINQRMDRQEAFQRELNCTFNHSFLDAGKYGLYSTSAYGAIGNRVPNKITEFHCKKKTREVAKFANKKATIFKAKNPTLTPNDFESNGIPSYPYQSSDKVSNLIRDFQQFYNDK